MAMEIPKMVLYGGGIILTYYILKSWGIIEDSCPPGWCTTECPKGPYYQKPLFGDCMAGYKLSWWEDRCYCLSQ